MKLVSNAMDQETDGLCTAVVVAEVEMMERITIRTECDSQDGID